MKAHLTWSQKKETEVVTLYRYVLTGCIPPNIIPSMTLVAFGDITTCVCVYMCVCVHVCLIFIVYQNESKLLKRVINSRSFYNYFFINFSLPTLSVHRAPFTVSVVCKEEPKIGEK